MPSFLSLFPLLYAGSTASRIICQAMIRGFNVARSTFPFELHVSIALNRESSQHSLVHKRKRTDVDDDDDDDDEKQQSLRAKRHSPGRPVAANVSSTTTSSSSPLSEYAKKKQEEQESARKEHITAEFIRSLKRKRAMSDPCPHISANSKMWETMMEEKLEWSPLPEESSDDEDGLTEKERLRRSQLARKRAKLSASLKEKEEQRAEKVVRDKKQAKKEAEKRKINARYEKMLLSMIAAQENTLMGEGKKDDTYHLSDWLDRNGDPFVVKHSPNKHVIEHSSKKHVAGDMPKQQDPKKTVTTIDSPNTRQEKPVKFHFTHHRTREEPQPSDDDEPAPTAGESWLDRQIREAEEEMAFEEEQRRLDSIQDQQQDGEEGLVDFSEMSLTSQQDQLKKTRFGKFITLLPSDWEAKVDTALAITKLSHTIGTTTAGVSITRNDISTVIPHSNNANNFRGTSGWLNDEIVNAWFTNLVNALNTKASYVKSPKNAAPYAAYPSAWYNNVTTKGVDNISRWSRRHGIQGPKLLETESVFLPINTGNHWIITCISGKRRTIAHFDSLSHSSASFFKIARRWLAMELGDAYVEDEWVEVGDKSAQQDNGSDCGVFTCLNGLAFAMGIEEPADVFGADDIVQARRNLVAVVINGGFKGDFEV